MITKKYYKLVKVSYEDSQIFYVKNVSDSAGTFSVSHLNKRSWNIKYSLDGVTWTTYDVTNFPTITVPAGSNIYLKGTNYYFNENNTYLSFSMDVEHIIGGNIMSLKDETNFSTLTSIGNSYMFKRLFFGDTHLVSAEKMNVGNVLTLNDYAFIECFQGCTSLVKAPLFDNCDTIYSNVFQNCFKGCTSLTDGGNFSNVTYVGGDAFSNCFSGCTSLTTPPVIDTYNITTLGTLRPFYAMFSDCTALQSGLDLRGITDSLIASTYDAFDQMYLGCNNLTTVYTPNISTWNTDLFTNWLNQAGSSATGTKTVYKPAALTIPTDSNSGVPTGWTVQNY